MEQSVDFFSIERFVFLVEIRIFEQIEQRIDLFGFCAACPEGAILVLGIEGFECFAKRAFGGGYGSIVG